MRTERSIRPALCLLLCLLLLRAVSPASAAGTAPPPVFRELHPTAPGAREVLLALSETPRQLRINLFAGEESIAKEAVWEEGHLRLRLNRALNSNETLLFLADGEDAAGRPFHFRQEWRVSLYDALTRQIKTVHREIEAFWPPEEGGIRLPYSLRQFEWISALPEFEPGPEAVGTNGLLLRDCSLGWQVHTAGPEDSILATWSPDRERGVYRSPPVDASAAPKELVIFQEMPPPENRVTEFVYDPETLKLRQIRVLFAGFAIPEISLICLCDPPAGASDAFLLQILAGTAEHIRVIGRYDAGGTLRAAETPGGLIPVQSPRDLIEGVVIVP